MIFYSLSGHIMACSGKILRTNKTPLSGLVKYHSISFKAFGDSKHVITLKHPAPISFPTLLGQHLGKSPQESAAHETTFIENSRRKDEL